MDSKREQVERTFMYPATNVGHTKKHIQIRDKAKELALLIVDLTPASREQSLALTELETSVFWANAAIRHE